MKIDWVLITTVGASAVGIIQYAKGFLPWAPSWAWGVGLPLLCVGLAALFTYTPAWVTAAVVALALGQIIYENVVKLVQKKINE